MLDTMPQSDLDTLRTSRNAFIDDFFFASSSQAGPSRLRSHSVDSEDGGGCDVQIVPKPGATGSSKRMSQRDADASSSTQSSRPKKKQKIAYGSIVTDEVQSRTKEALGLTGDGRRLGGGTKKPEPEVNRDREILDLTEEEPQAQHGKTWSCGICTL